MGSTGPLNCHVFYDYKFAVPEENNEKQSEIKQNRNYQNQSIKIIKLRTNIIDLERTALKTTKMIKFYERNVTKIIFYIK